MNIPSANAKNPLIKSMDSFVLFWPLGCIKSGWVLWQLGGMVKTHPFIVFFGFQNDTVDPFAFFEQNLFLIRGFSW